MKAVIKELLFSGARRSAKNKQKKKPIQIFEENVDLFDQE